MAKLYLGETEVAPVVTVKETVPDTLFGLSLADFITPPDADGLWQPVAKGNVSAVFSGVKTININSGYYKNIFQSNMAIKSILFPDLETVDDYAMTQMLTIIYLEEVDFPKLKSVGTSGMEKLCQSCNVLTRANFSALEEIGENALRNAFAYTALKTIAFPKLSSVSTNSFGTSSSNWAFTHTTQLESIHFPAAIQAVVEAMTGYAAKWGAPDTCQILFDL